MDQIYNLIQELGEVKADIAHIKATLDNQEKNNEEIERRLDRIVLTLEKLQDTMFPRRDLDAMFDQYRCLDKRVAVLEKAPDMKKIAFVNKSIAIILGIIVAAITAFGIATINNVGRRLGDHIQVYPMPEAYYENK